MAGIHGEEHPQTPATAHPSRRARSRLLTDALAGSEISFLCTNSYTQKYIYIYKQIFCECICMWVNLFSIFILLYIRTIQNNGIKWNKQKLWKIEINQFRISHFSFEFKWNNSSAQTHLHTNTHINNRSLCKKYGKSVKMWSEMRSPVMWESHLAYQPFR